MTAPPPRTNPRPGSRPRRRLRSARRGITALVVTCDEGMRAAVSARLQTAGIGVVYAGTPREALSCLENQSIELLVADIDEPRLDYGDLHKAVNAGHAFIRRIAIARRLGLTVALNAFRTGAIGVVGTPLDVDEFDRLLRQAKASVRVWLARLDHIAHPPAAKA